MTQLLRTLVAALAMCTTLVAGDDSMAPREVDWKTESPAVFDEQWRIPSTRVAAGDDETPDLLRLMKALATKRFAPREGEAHDAWTRSFGDIVRALQEAKSDAARRELLSDLRVERWSVWRVVGAYLPELVLVEEFHRDEWDPTDDDEPDDGLLLVAPFDRTVSGRLPWTDLGGTTDIYQGAALIHADLGAIKDAETDFTKYLADAGANYEYIHAVRGSYIRGTAADGSVRAALRIAFSDDLPFPYTTLDCHVHMLSSLNAAGHLVTDFYSTSDDVHWLAGQSVSIPVHDADGAWVTQLQVLVYGIDIVRVPEGGDSRRAIVRGNLGNLKRRAEQRFADAAPGPLVVQGSVPRFVVRGLGSEPTFDDE